MNLEESEKHFDLKSHSDILGTKRETLVSRGFHIFFTAN